MNDVTWGEWGEPTRVRIDHAAVWMFARAVKDRNPIYASDEAARAAGFDAVPCPPTFTISATWTCAFPDLQPPQGEQADVAARTAAIADRKGGLLLHGEQEYIYHRTPVVGDVLEARSRTSVPFMKEGKRPMEITYYETLWSDTDGNPVVSERVTSLFLPEGAP